jgi:hypothetical protein
VTRLGIASMTRNRNAVQIFRVPLEKEAQGRKKICRKLVVVQPSSITDVQKCSFQ